VRSPTPEPAAAGQPDRVGPFTAADVEGPSGRQAVGLGLELRVDPAAPDRLGAAVPLVPGGLLEHLGQQVAVGSERGLDLLLDEVHVERRADPEALRGRADHLGHRVADVAGHPEPRDRGGAGGLAGHRGAEHLSAQLD
jgi:hypothetical protein